MAETHNQKEELQSMWKVPSIAQFVSLFREDLKLPEIEIEELEDGLLQENELGTKTLQSLILALLKGSFGQRPIKPETFDEYLLKVVKRIWDPHKELPLTEEKNFADIDIPSKVDVLYSLCMYRLDRPDVEGHMKKMDADALRVQPLGCDEEGNEYWYFYGTRLYKQEPLKQKRNWDEEWDEQKNQSFTKRRRGRPRKGKMPVKPRKSDGESDDFEEMDGSPKDSRFSNIEEKSRWSVVCHTIEDWVDFAEKFKTSKSKCEQSLFTTVTDNFLPVLHEMYQEKDRRLQQKLRELIPHNYIITRRETRSQRMKANVPEMNEYEAEAAHREHIAKQRARRLEERNRRLNDTSVVRSSRKRSYVDYDEEEEESDEMESLADMQVQRSPLSDEEFNFKSHVLKIVANIKQQKCSYPFLYPVEEKYAPGYYEIITNPVDLSTIQTKLLSDMYININDIDADFEKMAYNSKLYHGDTSDVFQKAIKVWKLFREAICRMESGAKTPSEDTSRSSDSSCPEERKREKKKKRRSKCMETLEILSQQAEMAIEKAQSSDKDDSNSYIGTEKFNSLPQNSMFSDLKIYPIHSHPPAMIEKYTSDSSNQDIEDSNEHNDTTPHNTPSEEECEQQPAIDTVISDAEVVISSNHAAASSSPVVSVPGAPSRVTKMKAVQTINFIEDEEMVDKSNQYDAEDAASMKSNEDDTSAEQDTLKSAANPESLPLNNSLTYGEQNSLGSPVAQNVIYTGNPSGSKGSSPFSPSKNVVYTSEPSGSKGSSPFSSGNNIMYTNDPLGSKGSSPFSSSSPILNGQLRRSPLNANTYRGFNAEEMNNYLFGVPTSDTSSVQDYLTKQPSPQAQDNGQPIACGTDNQVLNEVFNYPQAQSNQEGLSQPQNYPNQGYETSQPSMPPSAFVPQIRSQYVSQVPYSSAFPNSKLLRLNLPPSCGKLVLVREKPDAPMSYHLVAQTHANPSKTIEESNQKQANTQFVMNKSTLQRQGPPLGDSPATKISHLSPAGTFNHSNTQSVQSSNASHVISSVAYNSATVMKPTQMNSGVRPTPTTLQNNPFETLCPKTLPVVLPSYRLSNQSAHLATTSATLNTARGVVPQGAPQNINFVFPNGGNGQNFMVAPAPKDIPPMGTHQNVKMVNLQGGSTTDLSVPTTFYSATNTNVLQSYALQNVTLPQVVPQVLPTTQAPQFGSYYIMSDANNFPNVRYPGMNIQPVPFQSR